MVTKLLTEKAAKWYEVYRNLSLTWAKFPSLLVQQFAEVLALNKLHIKLYAAKQEEKEAVGVFSRKKYMIALRLLPQATEGQTVALLLEAIHTENGNPFRNCHDGTSEFLTLTSVPLMSRKALS